MTAQQPTESGSNRGVELLRTVLARRSLFAWAAMAIMLVVPLVTENESFASTASFAALDAIAGIGVAIIYGHCGQLSFGHATLFGVASYVSAYLAVDFGAGAGICIVVGTLAAVVIGTLVALPALRIRGIQLSLITLGLTLAGTEVFAQVSGYSGISVPPPSVFGSQDTSSTFQLVAIVVGLALAYLLGRRLVRAPMGMRMMSVSADESTASSHGINVVRTKMAAFGVSSAFIGVAGAVYPMVLLYLSPDSFNFSLVSTLFVITIVGGVLSLEGVIVAALVLGSLPTLIESEPNIVNLAYGILFLVIMIVLPGGIIAGVTARRRHKAKVGTRLRDARGGSGPGGGRRHAAPARPAGPSTGPVLEVSDVSVSFGGVKALSSVNLAIGRGEIVGIVGSNGAGKSTLVNVITGYQRPDSGRVVLAGTALEAMPSHKRARAGLVRTFQFPVFSDSLPMWQCVDTAWHSLHQSAGSGSDAYDLLSTSGLLENEDTLVNELPFGLQKLVDLARVVGGDPIVVLLDEPTTGLTPSEIPPVARCLEKLRERGIGIGIIEHNIGFVAGLADRLIAMDHGVVITEGAPDEVLADNRVLAAFGSVIA